VKKLLVILGLLICVACAQKGNNFKPTPEQSESILRKQFDAREAFGNWQRALASLQASCDEVIKANGWAPGTTCTAKTAPDVQSVLLQPITFSQPAAKEAKK
jgi:hypothetical protein